MAETALPAPEFGCDCTMHITYAASATDNAFPGGAVIDLVDLRELVSHTKTISGDAPVQVHPNGLLVVHAASHHLDDTIG